MKKKDFSKYNDGVVFIFREKNNRAELFTNKNVETVDDMELLGKLAFQETAKRERDMEFAQQNDFSLTMKIKTRLVKQVNNKCKAVIDGYLYDVSYVDKNDGEMWLYLEGVKAIDSKRY